jgi:predicted DNA-binding protein
MNATIQQLQEDIRRLKAELAEREAALPMHSVRPHQLMAIEALEDEISRKEDALNALETKSRNASTEVDDS